MHKRFSPLSQPTPLRERAAEAIRNAILEARILPGDKIPEQDLAAELGISRVPVREAIRILEQQGLLVIRPQSGTFVRKLSYEELTDGDRVRASLEKLAAKEAMERSEGQRWQALCDELKLLVGRMRQAVAEGNPLLKTKTDLEFHTKLIDAAQNSQLSEIWRSLGLPLRFMAPTRTFGLATDEESALSIANHERLVALLEERNLQECESQIDEHAHWQLRLRAKMNKAADMREAQTRQEEPAR